MCVRIRRRGYILHLVACVPSQSFSSFNYKEWERRWHHAMVFFIHWIGATHSFCNYNPDNFFTAGVCNVKNFMSHAKNIYISLFLKGWIMNFKAALVGLLRSELSWNRGVNCLEYALDFEWKQMVFLFISQPRGVCLSIEECALVPL